MSNREIKTLAHAAEMAKSLLEAAADARDGEQSRFIDGAKIMLRVALQPHLNHDDLWDWEGGS